MTNYFVTVKGTKVAENLTRDQAIERAKKEYTDQLGTLNIGIGNYKFRKGVKTYSLTPMHFYI